MYTTAVKSDSSVTEIIGKFIHNIMKCCYCELSFIVAGVILAVLLLIIIVTIIVTIVLYRTKRSKLIHCINNDIVTCIDKWMPEENNGSTENNTALL